MCAVAVVLLEIVAWRHDVSAKNRLRRTFEVGLSRVLSLISDLSDLTAREFDLWVVDLYLPQQSFVWFLRRDVLDLELSMHITLTDVRVVPSRIERNHFFGQCFIDGQPRLWWNTDFASSSNENYWHNLSDLDNRIMAERYGVASVNPVVDNLGKECSGLLVVHAKGDEEVVTKVLGALQQSEGRRRMAAACLDIHGHLQKS